MRIENEALLASYRVHDKCESCGLRVFCCAAHVFGRGAGRIDHPINLIRLGANPLNGCRCHLVSHNDPSDYPNHEDLLRIVAKREKTTPEAITAVIHMIRRLPKSPPMGLVEAEVNSLGYDAQVLAMKVLKDCGVILPCQGK